MEKVLVWGTGSIAADVLKKGLNAEVLGFIQTIKSAELYRGKRVFGIDEIPQDYDFIIVANSFANDIYHLCIEKKINIDKMIFLKQLKRKEGFSDLKKIHDLLGEKNYIDYCVEFGLYKDSFFGTDAKIYEQLNTRDNFKIQEKYMWPVITDKYTFAGNMGNYFWQDLWAAKLIYKSNIKRHFDIGSRVDGFIAHLLAMDIEVSLIDIREFPGKIEHLHTIVDDATRLTQISDNSIESMSALCSLEHFGLGRYGDPVDPNACFRCFYEIQKKITKGGNVYISVPIGRERVEFNAHRVFYPTTIIESFSSLKLKEFSCVAKGKIERNIDIHEYDDDNHNGEYRYGLFHFLKE